MGWRDLLQDTNASAVMPWLGGRELVYLSGQAWQIEGQLPPEHGWWQWQFKGRKISWLPAADQSAAPDVLRTIPGYLVGDRFVPDLGWDGNGHAQLPVPVLTLKAIAAFNRVQLIEPGLDRFTHVYVTEIVDQLIYMGPAMPLGPETDVLAAFLDERPSVADVKGVTPGLDLAFRLESWQRAEIKRREAELEQARLAEEAQRAAEERRQALIKQLGDGAGRRELAKVDFVAAARAALRISGADLIDHKLVGRGGQHVVRFRLDGSRYECVVDDNLRVTDAGICLVDHRNGVKGDNRFTLESLPGVIREAIDAHKLVIFRHA